MKTSEQIEVLLPREAYTLLAQANLLRMRGCWDEAVAKCMDALRLAPDSASAQSLLGDIYENQGRCDDAIQWYRMALDVNPDSPADRIKLNRLLEFAHPRPTDSLHGELVRTGQAPAQSQRVFAEVGADRLLRGMAWLAAALFLLAAVLAGVVMSRHHDDLVPITAPTIVVPTSDSSPTSEPSEGAAPTPVTPPASPTTVATPAADPAEVTLLQTLQEDTTLAAQGIVPEGVQIDPRQNAVTLTVMCPTPTVETPMRLALLRDATLAGLAGTRAQGDRVGQWTIRCLASTAGSTDATTGLALVADTTTAAIASLGFDPDTLPPSQLLSAFHNIWWSPSVPE